MSDQQVKTGDRVRLWFGTPSHGRWEYGEVVGVDDGPRPGVRVLLDRFVNGIGTCYATHEEVETAA